MAGLPALQIEESAANGGIHPANLVRTLNAVLDKSTIIVDDSQSLGYFMKRGYTLNLTQLAEPGLDIATIARGFGITAHAVSSIDNLEKALIGAHDLTIPAQVLLEMGCDPQSEQAVEKFHHDWQQMKIQ